MISYTQLYLKHSLKIASGAAAIGVLLAGPAQAKLYDTNDAFNVPSGKGPTTLTTGPDGGSGPSAAQNWSVFNDNAGTTTTELLPSTLVTGGTMIHVTTTNIASGIYQVFPKPGPTSVFTLARGST